MTASCIRAIFDYQSEDKPCFDNRFQWPLGGSHLQFMSHESESVPDGFVLPNTNCFQIIPIFVRSDLNLSVLFS